LQHGDKILTLDGKEIEDFYDIVPELVYNGAQSIQIDRNNQKLNIAVPENFVGRYIQEKSFIDYTYPFVAYDFTGDSPAKASGMQQGDEIVGVNGQELHFFQLIVIEIQKNIGKTISLDVLRDGQKHSLEMEVPESGKIGVYKNPSDFLDFADMRYGFFASIPAGVGKGVGMIKSYLQDLKLVFSPKTKAYKELGGFIAIGNIFPEEWNWYRFWMLTAFLSIMLGVLNLLPIPALDGGHVLFLIIEMITGRRPRDKFMEYAQIVGMLLLLALVLYANGNDIIKLFTK